MKRKFFFVLFSVVLLAVACTPVVTDSDARENPIVPAAAVNTAVIPVTNESISVPQREAQQPRLLSGEILDSDSPDTNVNQNQIIQAPASPADDQACFSEDDIVRPQGGCIE